MKKTKKSEEELNHQRTQEKTDHKFRMMVKDVEEISTKLRILVELTDFRPNKDTLYSFKKLCTKILQQINDDQVSIPNTMSM